MNKNKSIELNQINSLIDVSLSEFKSETLSFLNVLDNISTNIRKIESVLSELKISLPFWYLAGEEISKRSIPDRLEILEHYEDLYPGFGGFTDKRAWYLSWQSIEKSKDFRLFLIIEETEYVSFINSDKIEVKEVSSKKCKFKRPLIDTDLQTRLKYFEYLKPFLDSFKRYLQEYRISIERFSMEDLPF